MIDVCIDNRLKRFLKNRTVNEIQIQWKFRGISLQLTHAVCGDIADVVLAAPDLAGVHLDLVHHVVVVRAGGVHQEVHRALGL